MAFSVHNDTMTVYSAQPIHYFIEECLSYSLRYRTSVGETVSLHKSESDTLSFGTVVPVKVVENGVFEKDSVIFHGGERYRGYAYINPTKKRVTLVSINEEGLPVENIYYDNIIHICVYKGKDRLFSKDINKEMFARVVPADFLNNAILSDMDFVRVDEKGYRYVVTLCIPDGAACYNVRLDVSKEGTSFSLVEREGIMKKYPPDCLDENRSLEDIFLFCLLFERTVYLFYVIEDFLPSGFVFRRRDKMRRQLFPLLFQRVQEAVYAGLRLSHALLVGFGEDQAKGMPFSPSHSMNSRSMRCGSSRLSMRTNRQVICSRSST